MLTLYKYLEGIEYVYKIYFKRKDATEDKVFAKSRLCYNSIIRHKNDILELEINSSKLKIENEEDLQNVLKVIDTFNADDNQ